MKLFRKLKLGLIIFATVIFALAASYGWFSVCYAQKIYPGVKIGSLNFSGLSKSQAKELLEKKAAEAKDAQIIFSYGDKEWKLTGADIDLSYNLDKTADLLYQEGRNQGFWKNIATQVKLVLKHDNLLTAYDFSKDKLNSFLFPIFSQIEIPVIDAGFQYQDGKIEVTPEKTGKEVNKFELNNSLNISLGNFYNPNQINLQIETKNPKITQAQVNLLLDQITRVTADSIKLKSEVKEVDVSQEQIAGWIDLVAETQKLQNNFQPKVIVNQEKIKAFVASMAEDINKETSNAKLTFADGKVNIFQAGERGYKLDQEQTIKDIANLLTARLQVAGINSATNDPKNTNELNLMVTSTDPDVNDQNINNLGIKELIATGTTSFTGSPSNRIFNIKHGAELFHGIVIGPGDTLSAIATLGNPSAATGYLPELVIKENKTIPEYGGGLCQVSTTLFRAALNAGLEIPERTNHSYRVSYYEPPVGMDATVYYPSPDLKIKNNTSTYILIQTSVSGSSITFNFYGTKDGRSVEISQPSLYNITAPPEAQYVESDSLAPGEIKRLESSHNGSTVDFHYKVTLSGKVIIDQNFHSVYKAWQARYLYGVGAEIPGQGNSQPAPIENTPAPETPTSNPAPTSTSSTSSSPSPTPTPTTSSSTSSPTPTISTP